MKITSENNTNTYAKQARPNFGMPISYTDEAATYLGRRLAKLSPIKQSEYLKRLADLKEKLAENPILVSVKLNSSGELLARVPNHNSAFFPRWFSVNSAIKAIERAGKCAEIANTLKTPSL